jgi:hypothetical protein
LQGLNGQGLETSSPLPDLDKFAVAALFVSRGDPRPLGRILAAYGRSFNSRELLACTLLHVHSNRPSA